MPRLGRAARTRRRNAQRARETLALREGPFRAETKLNGLQFAFSVIVNGLGYTTAAKVFMENNIVPPSQTCFYNYIREVINQIISLAQESAAFYRSQMKPETVVSMDGSWDHRRNGRYCIVDAVDLKQKKIIAIAVLQRKHTPPLILAALRTWKFSAAVNLPPNSLTTRGSLAIAMIMTALCEAYLQRRVLPGMNSSTRIIR